MHDFFGHILLGYIYFSNSFIFVSPSIGVCGIISQRELNEIWIWWSNILKCL